MEKKCSALITKKCLKIISLLICIILIISLLRNIFLQCQNISCDLKNPSPNFLDDIAADIISLKQKINEIYIYMLFYY